MSDEKDKAALVLCLVFGRAAKFDVHCYAVAVAMGFESGACGMSPAEAAQWFEISSVALDEMIREAARQIGPELTFLGRHREPG